MLEAFLAKIVGLVFKKAALSGMVATLGTAYSVCSLMEDIGDVISSTNDCDGLGVSGVQVVSDTMTDAAMEQLLGASGRAQHRFSAKRSQSGIFVVTRTVPKLRSIVIPDVVSAAIPTKKLREY